MTDPMENRAFDRSNRAVRHSQYGWWEAGQASDGPVDAWVDDMEGDWADWEEITVVASVPGDTEADANRDPLVRRLAPVTPVPLVVPAESVVMERTALDR